MKLRPLLLTVLVLAALSAAVWYRQRPAAPAAADPRLGRPLLDPALVDRAVHWKITGDTGTVALDRAADGTWTVASYYGFPADQSRLSGLVGELVEAKLQRLVTSSPERIARLGFKDARIEARDAAGQPLWAVTLGKNAETGGGRFVRFGDENKAWLANLNAWLDPESRNWARTELLALKPEDIAAVAVAWPAGGKAEFRRAKATEPWTTPTVPAGQVVNADRVTSAVSALTGLRFSDTAETTDPEFATALAHAQEYRLTTFDGHTFTVAIGRKPEEKKPKPAAAPASAETAAAGAAPATPPAKPAEPEFETIPAGPVFVKITAGDAGATINAMMAKRAFKVYDGTFTGLPANPDELFKPATPPPADKPATPPAPTGK